MTCLWAKAYPLMSQSFATKLAPALGSESQLCPALWHSEVQSVSSFGPMQTLRRVYKDIHVNSLSLCLLARTLRENAVKVGTESSVLGGFIEQLLIID